jgi:hypothetical protein
MGSLLAHEPLTTRILASALVIVSAVVLINIGRARMTRLVHNMALSTSSGDD